jgi:hypothetical protein
MDLDLGHSFNLRLERSLAIAIASGNIRAYALRLRQRGELRGHQEGQQSSINQAFSQSHSRIPPGGSAMYLNRDNLPICKNEDQKETECHSAGPCCHL